jgi:catechol 2,3-dioxygenase-like lactoylglutathione lyase family enzyme
MGPGFRAAGLFAPVRPLVGALDQGPTRESTGATDRPRRDACGDTDRYLEVSMSTDLTSAASTDTAAPSTIDMALEVITLPVSDVDRAKAFYRSLGWRFDIDLVVSDDLRTVQFTPPHSPCSIQFGTGGTTAEPGSAQMTFLVVEDINAARDDLVSRGVAVSEVKVARPPAFEGPQEERSYFARASFSDPDGNSWVLQEITTRLPGRTWED